MCINQYLASRDERVNLAPDQAQRLITEIGQSIGVRAGSIVLVPCEFTTKVQAFYSDGAAVPAGEYIIYNERWVHEVIGSDEIQAIALFGHELGHFLNRDFSAHRTTLPRATLEAQADRFAGCAVARSRGAWTDLENLLSRLRLEAETSYPNQAESLAAARVGFRGCGGIIDEPTNNALTASVISPLTGLCRLYDESMTPHLSINGRFQPDGQILSEDGAAQIGSWWRNGNRVLVEMRYNRDGAEHSATHTGRILDDAIELDRPDVSLWCRPAN